MTISRKIFGDLAEAILEGGARSAVKYFGEKTVVKATRRGKIDKRKKHIEILFSIGPPNFNERRFIKRLKKGGKRFQARQIQITWPKKKK